jgi:hypothetical protein
MQNAFTKVAVGAMMFMLGGFVTQAQSLTQTNAFLPDPAFYPQYIGSGTSTRIPCMFRATLTNLAANTTYRYYVQVGTNSDLGVNQSGAANSMLVNSAGTTFTYTTGPGLTTAGNYETFTTDAAGTYTGWFGFVHSGNARFTAGAILFPTITIGNTSGTVLFRYAPPAASGTFTCLGFSASAGASNGTGIRGTNSSATAKNFVVLHDTVSGTGRPLAVTFVESDANNLASGAAFYGATGAGPVDGIAGAWGTIVPNTLANGVRRIAQYNNAGALVGGNTSTDGRWPATIGTITANPAGGTTAIDITNIALNVAYTVAYNNNGGTGAQTDVGSPYAVGSTVTTLGLGTIARTGFSFTGWNTAANGSGTSYATNVTFTINNNTTLFAQWVSAPITSTTLLNSSANPSIYSNSVTFTASVQTNGVTAGNATSNYVFKVDGVAVATNAVSGGSATYTVSTLVSGARTITAEYAGDANYTKSTNSLTQTVNKATTTATLAVNNSPVTYSGVGQSATVSITASNTPGTVQNILTGGAATQTASGTYAVTANYVPTDTNYTTLTGVSAGNFVINKATATATLAVNNSPATYNGAGQSAIVSITASNTPGSVQNVLTGGTATQTASGTYAVTANYVPTDTNFTTLTGLSAGNFIINKATPSFNLVTSVNPSGYKDGVNFTASSFAATLTGSVQFTTNGANFGSAVTISGASATSDSTAGLPRGANAVTAIYSGDANYFSFTNSLTQTVTNHPPVVVNLAATRAAGSTTWKIAVSDLLTNATDVDLDTLSLVSVSASTNGAALFIGGGFVLYTNTNLVGDQFSYTVTDGFGGTNSALVNLAIATGTPGGQAQSVAISGVTATLQFAGIPGFSYNVQRTTNLVDWATILTTNPVAGVFQFTDDFSDLGGVIPASAYYRLGWNP